MENNSIKIDEVAQNIADLRKIMQQLTGLFTEISGFREDTQKALTVDPRISILEKRVKEITQFVGHFVRRYNNLVSDIGTNTLRDTQFMPVEWIDMFDPLGQTTHERPAFPDDK